MIDKSCEFARIERTVSSRGAGIQSLFWSERPDVDNPPYGGFAEIYGCNAAINLDCLNVWKRYVA